MIRKITSFYIFVSLFTVHLNLFANTINTKQAKVLYAKYTTVPKIVYTKQRFNINLQLNIFLEDDQFFRISTHVPDAQNLLYTNTEIVWYMNEENQYETTLKFKASNDPFTFPPIEVSLYDNDGNKIDAITLEPPNIIFRKIAINQERYANIVAQELSVSTVKSRQFSNDEIMVLFELEATDANLEEFYIAKYKNQGLKDIVIKDNIQKIYYFVMIPIFEKEIIFEYYNPKISDFIEVVIPIELEEELVSTQTNLNPYENDMDFYKKIALIVIILFVISLYLFRGKRIYLFIAIVLMTYLISFFFPKPTMNLQSGEKVYILPTKNSTIFKIVKEDESVEILNETKKYKKVLFQNNQIGWIKND